MTKAATWLVISGFLFLALGLVLRTVLMMRSSDATPVGGRILYGGELVRQYRIRFPASPMPLLARSTLLAGLAALAAGIAIDLSS